MPGQIPPTIVDFSTLPVLLSGHIPINGQSHPRPHYIYIKPYDPRIPEPDSSRSLFLVNIPVLSTSAHLKDLFIRQLQCPHIEKIHFASDSVRTGGNGIVASTTSSNTTTDTNSNTAANTSTSTSTSTTLGKRKRNEPTPEEIRSQLSRIALPSVKSSQYQLSGSTAIITFLDRTARDLAYKHVRRAGKNACALVNKTISSASLDLSGIEAKGMPIWPTSNDLGLPLLTGRSRYKHSHKLIYPPRAELLGVVEEYMSTYALLENAMSRESRQKRTTVDEDGFTVVTRGSKGAVKMSEVDEARVKAEGKKMKKKEGFEDFYRFQHRERRREEAEGLKRRFEMESGFVRGLRERKGQETQ